LEPFQSTTLRMLASRCGLQVDEVSTVFSPVNWVLSLHNILTDWGAPRWVVDRFGIHSAGALALFTMVDAVHQVFGRGALLRATFRRGA
jgi:hypothetical protein